MLPMTQNDLCFSAEAVRGGLRYHFQELGICRELEEGLADLIDENIGSRGVYFRQDVWNAAIGDFDRAMILMDLAQISRDDLEQSPQGMRFLELERLLIEAEEEEAQ
jgi:hypothetical protein